MTLTKDFASLKYEKTDDPNIVKQIKTVTSEIHLDKLEKDIADLETELKDMPDEIVLPTDKVEQEAELKRKKEFLKKLKIL